ncbi:MAG TPA: UV DNA damage repair endonuclease UvsE [Lachnospiraceae bacterium]|jgi:UV DNA damage endonuclease|nr:UV DNA damage repair endonuclease UvsE [Bacillota bacterium]HCR82703.1 UV DNA damage repair endonuclease UvsE [Lachnospiraceae bacterium]
MNVGYACLTVGVSGTKQRTCIMKNATPDVLSTLIRANLEALDHILDYNITNGLKLFRVSSNIIPFGSHPVNALKWWEDFHAQLEGLGHKALSNGLRLSMHPGQYTVLNSPDAGVVRQAVADLRYHTQFLDAMGLGKEHKIVLHIGGTYGDKKAAMKRFTEQYHQLNEDIRQRLVIENDDRHYSISEVLAIGLAEGIPVVFDNLHNRVNPDKGGHRNYTEMEWIAACAQTWHAEDGRPKIHYSQQDPSKRPGSHSATLDAGAFAAFCQDLGDCRVDIMVEVKDKNLSAVKCANAIATPDIRRLEREWSRYKYLVLEHSQRIYLAIRQLLKDKGVYPVIEFYRLIDKALMTPTNPANAVNAAQHVWGYFKDTTDEQTRRRFEKSLDQVSRGESTISLKRLLQKLTVVQQQPYLLDSLYFSELL